MSTDLRSRRPAFACGLPMAAATGLVGCGGGSRDTGTATTPGAPAVDGAADGKRSASIAFTARHPMAAVPPRRHGHLPVPATLREGQAVMKLPRACTAWLARAAMLATALCASVSHAHLMVAQRGTLNLVGDGAYMVMSLPVSAFRGIDDDGDGRLSLAEGSAHLQAIEAQVRSGLQLIDRQGPLSLDGVMVTLSPPDGAPTAAAAQLVVVGRYAMRNGADRLVFKQSLFGSGAAERTQEVTVTRGTQRQRMVLAPGREQGDVLPSAWAVLVDHASLGAQHVLAGVDHLLFLLVVLATGWSLRQTILALTCFTAGHATTLALCAWLGWVAPSIWVEPAIAATIVGMVTFDLWSRRRAHPWPAGLRLGLVFGCSLVHGLGFAGALTSLALDREDLLFSVAGFNLGIEAAQVAVALLATGAMQVVLRLSGPAGRDLTTRLASYSAFAFGSVWLVQRVCQSS